MANWNSVRLFDDTLGGHRARVCEWVWLAAAAQCVRVCYMMCVCVLVLCENAGNAVVWLESLAGSFYTCVADQWYGQDGDGSVFLSFFSWNILRNGSWVPLLYAADRSRDSCSAFRVRHGMRYALARVYYLRNHNAIKADHTHSYDAFVGLVGAIGAVVFVLRAASIVWRMHGSSSY